MRILRSQLACFPMLLTVLLIEIAPAAHVVSCTVSAAMSASDRASLQASASNFGGDVARGDMAALQSASASALAKNFTDFATVVEALAPVLKGSAIIVENLYALHVGDLKGTEDDAQFCSRSAPYC